MQCSSYERDHRGETVASAGIDRARDLLEATLATSRQDIHAIATQFERLAAKVQLVIELTSGIVDCVQQDWVQSIVPMARALASSAQRFIDERIESLTAVSTVFTSESAMLENLLSLTTEQSSIAREGKTLGVLARIEVARLGGAGKGFEYMARELDEFSAMVSTGAAEVRTEAHQRRKTLIDRRRKLNFALQRRRAYFNDIESELGHAIATMDHALVAFARIPADFQECVARIAGNISRVVEAVQMQDITRQQTEHVRDMLMSISSDLGNCEAPNGHRQTRHPAILRVQAFQIESARTSTAEWVSQINQCLESILQAGSSDVAAIGAKILEQERGLSSQLSRIERLEQDCAADDAEIEAYLVGIGELMRTTKAHLERSRNARDRMQLLNFNSMIEARHLGSQATAVLEITRNIGRISTGWSELTARSGDALASMLSSSARAEEVHRTKTRASLQNLGNARRKSHGGVAALAKAAAIAGNNGARVGAAVTALHDDSIVLERIAGRLAHAIVLMEEARNQIESSGAACPPGPVALTWDDRQQIENECAAMYTSELERRVLRAALDGEAIPAVAATVTGNDVELF